MTLLSDVGGAAGLVLGMSLATIIGTIDCIFTSFYNWVRTYFKREKVRTEARPTEQSLIYLNMTRGPQASYDVALNTVACEKISKVSDWKFLPVTMNMTDQ